MAIITMLEAARKKKSQMYEEQHYVNNDDTYEVEKQRKMSAEP